MIRSRPNFNLGIAVRAAAALLSIGTEYAEDEQWQIALDVYTEALKRHPTLAEGYYRRAVAYSALERFAEARDDFDAALFLGLEHAALYFHRGYMFHCFLAAIPQFARQNYDKAIALDPDHVEAHYQRGRLCLEGMNYEQALADFNRVIAAQPDHSAAIKSRGATYCGLYQWDNAIADFTHLIAHNSHEKMHVAYYNRAIAHRLNSQRQRAIEDFEASLRIKSDYQLAKEGLRNLLKNKW